MKKLFGLFDLFVFVVFFITLVYCASIDALDIINPFNHVVQARVDGYSMENALHDNDLIKIDKAYDNLQEGDIVTFDKVKYGKKYDLVKRIVATENDTLSMKNYCLYINDEFIDDVYFVGIIMPNGDILESYTLKKDEFFVLGDNRGNSNDSRSLGIILKSDIEGKVISVNGETPKPFSYK